MLVRTDIRRRSGPGHEVSSGRNHVVPDGAAEATHATGAPTSVSSPTRYQRYPSASIGPSRISTRLPRRNGVSTRNGSASAADVDGASLTFSSAALTTARDSRASVAAVGAGSD